MKINPHGFSLIELLIVLTITGILLSLTIPSYTTYITQQKRLSAQIELIHLAGQMEAFYMQRNTYEGATLAELQNPKLTDDYQLTILYQTATDFELAAIPINQQAKRDTECGTLVVNSHGLRHASLDPDLKKCW